MNIKPIDPELVAQLSNDEYSMLIRGVELLNNGTSEADFPPELQVVTFRLLRSVGAKNVRDFNGMRIAALVFEKRRVLIERLRQFR